MGYPGQLIMLFCGILCVAGGITVYLEAALINLPPEGLALAILDRLPRSKFGRVKVALDSTLVLLAVAVSLVYAGIVHDVREYASTGIVSTALAFVANVQGVREGTLIAALLTGRLVPLLRKAVIPLLGRLGFYPVSGGSS